MHQAGSGPWLVGVPPLLLSWTYDLPWASRDFGHGVLVLLVLFPTAALGVQVSFRSLPPDFFDSPCRSGSCRYLTEACRSINLAIRRGISDAAFWTVTTLLRLEFAGLAPAFFPATGQSLQRCIKTSQCRVRAPLPP